MLFLMISRKSYFSLLKLKEFISCSDWRWFVLNRGLFRCAKAGLQFYQFQQSTGRMDAVCALRYTWREHSLLAVHSPPLFSVTYWSTSAAEELSFELFYRRVLQRAAELSFELFYKENASLLSSCLAMYSVENWVLVLINVACQPRQSCTVSFLVNGNPMWMIPGLFSANAFSKDSEWLTLRYFS